MINFLKFVCCSLNCGEQIPSKRIIYSSTGSINNDFDDVRKYLKAGISAGNRFLSTGARSPLLITLPTDRFPNAQLASSIGFLHSLYTPLLLREKNKNFIEKADLIGILEIKKEYFNKTENLLPVGSLVDFLHAIQYSF
ncbi:CYTOSOL_AP domain-containing protein [Meloidogyne graminicola]|uniref:CYTOSOL_AP domain-containing protein n=1 Tax=Meloidogyne graminicola TaxID=189291 RepID=A0A8S9ZZF6_9BILA|nr:CYTOSOL_AP domain-containing protein [Meloidogyne graminicola]